MKLDAVRFGIAVGGATAILWVVCSGLVALFAGSMATMAGHMFHMDGSSMELTMTFVGFLFGLILWTVCAAIAGWLIGVIYNAVGGASPVPGTSY